MTRVFLLIWVQIKKNDQMYIL